MLRSWTFTEQTDTSPNSCQIFTVPQQEEQYDHLDELEVSRVEKQVNDAMAWMNSKMNQQNSQDLTLDPVVKVVEILAKCKVLKVPQDAYRHDVSKCFVPLL